MSSVVPVRIAPVHRVNGVNRRAVGPLLLALMTSGCALNGVPAAARKPAAVPPGPAMPLPAVNLAHLQHLYADIEVDGRSMGVVHIYAKAPDYRYAIEPNEGFTCVDDVARAMVLLAREWHRQQHPELQRKLRQMTEFVLHLQNENGYFNNFLWNDLRINTDYRTSVAELNWWSLRALWALEEAHAVLASDLAFGGRIRAATARVVHNIVRDLASRPRRHTLHAGIRVPTWLPGESGADQAAEAVNALLPHWRRTGDAGARRVIEAMADGIVQMQAGDAGRYPYGVFLSWRNLWHAWGNVQAYALLSAGQALQRRDYISAALIEVDHFYPYLLKNGFAEQFELRADGAGFAETSRRRHPQIAYGLRPMVFAALKAHELTADPKHAALAAELTAWLSGHNDAGAALYDARSGIVFDGILSGGRLNRDSGAESTIEALLTLQAMRDGLR